MQTDTHSTPTIAMFAIVGKLATVPRLQRFCEWCSAPCSMRAHQRFCAPRCRLRAWRAAGAARQAGLGTAGQD